MLHWLGVKPSYSRPRVSDDNAFEESLFRTAKYRPQFPTKGFKSLENARQWGREFVNWYNVNHRHSGIRYFSPAQRHAVEDQKILAVQTSSDKKVGCMMDATTTLACSSSSQEIIGGIYFHFRLNL